MHEFELPYGLARVFYPEVSEERYPAALLIEVDPLQIARRAFGMADAAPLGAYVNDRPYVASSYLSVALARVFGSTLADRSKKRPGLAAGPRPLTATIEVVPAADENVPHRLFEPLGDHVETWRLVVDVLDGPPSSNSGPSSYVKLRLEGTGRLAELLPVLDDAKHYYIGDDEVEKLFARGDVWLAAHPEREFIAAGVARLGCARC